MKRAQTSTQSIHTGITFHGVILPKWMGAGLLWSAQLAWIMLLCGGALIVSIRKPWLLSHTLLHDDSFYYLKIAAHWAQTGILSFSGIGATTGFHPLWAYLLGIGIRALSTIGVPITHSPLICAVLLSGMNALLFTIANYKAVRALGGDHQKATLTTLVLFGFTWRFLFDGMESGILLSLLASSVWAAACGQFCLTGLCVAFIVWARVDAVLLTVAPCAIALLGIRRLPYKHSPHRQIMTPHMLKALLMLGTPVLISVTLRGILTDSPTSSEAKFYWFALDMMRCAETHLGALRHVGHTLVGAARGLAQIFDPLAAALNPVLCYNSNFVPSVVPPALLVGACFSWLCILLDRTRQRSKFDVEWHRILYAALFIGLAVSYLLVVGFFRLWRPGWDWYLAGPTYWVLFSAFLAYDAWKMRCLDAPSQRGLPLLPLVLVLCLLVGNIRFFHGVLRPKPDEWRSVYNLIVQTIDKMPLKENQSVGTWAAGHVGYFCRHRVVNLEGLVESREVLTASMADDIRPLLSSHRIAYIVIKAKPSDIRAAVNAAHAGVPKWRMSIRKRVFKDLDWEPVFVTHDSQLRSLFSILQVTTREARPTSIVSEDCTAPPVVKAVPPEHTKALDSALYRLKGKKEEEQGLHLTQTDRAMLGLF